MPREPYRLPLTADLQRIFFGSSPVPEEPVERREMFGPMRPSGFLSQCEEEDDDIAITASRSRLKIRRVAGPRRGRPVALPPGSMVILPGAFEQFIEWCRECD